MIGDPINPFGDGGGTPKSWRTPIIPQTGEPSNPLGYGGGISKGWKTSIVLQMVGDPNWGFFAWLWGHLTLQSPGGPQNSAVIAPRFITWKFHWVILATIFTFLGLGSGLSLGSPLSPLGLTHAGQLCCSFLITSSSPRSFLQV